MNEGLNSLQCLTPLLSYLIGEIEDCRNAMLFPEWRKRNLQIINHPAGDVFEADTAVSLLDQSIKTRIDRENAPFLGNTLGIKINTKYMLI